MHSQSGQVGIIVLLIVVVMSTIGISMVSQSSMDVNISKSSEDANRALDAAESGVEKALSDSSALDPNSPAAVSGSINTITDLGINYTVNKTNSLDTILDEGYSAGLNVVGATGGSGTLDIYWSKEANCAANPASLIITVYSAAGTTPAYRKIFAGACTQVPDDGFTIIGSGGNGYFRHTTVTIQSTDVLVRIRSVYNQTNLRVQGGAGLTLPVQQFRVNSTAQNQSSQETKAVQVERSLPMAPSIFDYALYSGTGITSN